MVIAFMRPHSETPTRDSAASNIADQLSSSLLEETSPRRKSLTSLLTSFDNGERNPERSESAQGLNRLFQGIIGEAAKALPLALAVAPLLLPELKILRNLKPERIETAVNGLCERRYFRTGSQTGSLSMSPA